MDEEYVIICGCGREMQATWRGPRRSYRCGCGAYVSHIYDVRASRGHLARDRCQIWIGQARCGNEVIPGWESKAGKQEYAAAGMMCQECALRLLNESMRHPVTRDYIVKSLAQGELEETRQQIAVDDFRKKLEDREQRKLAAEAEMVHVVYYVRLGEDHIKIGTTGRLAERMLELRVANPDNLLAAEPGTVELEKQRHGQFRKLKYDRRKEDFAESDSLAEHVAMVRQDWGDPWTLVDRLVANEGVAS